MATSPDATVTPAMPFDPEGAAQGLRKAMKGLGTDEKTIIQILSSHSNEQRREIERMFKTMNGRDLRSDLKNELSGRFEDVVIAMLDPPRLYDANECHRAIKGAGTDEDALIDILVCRSNSEIMEIRALYKTHYKKDLEKDIVSDTSGHFERLMRSLANANREEQASVDHSLAEREAEELKKAGIKQLGTDEETFNRILCLRSYPQLHATCDAYKKVASKDLEDSIKSEMSCNLERGFLAIVQVAQHGRPYFVARRLHDSMAGAGTKDNALIRLVVSSSETDMKSVKKQFQRMYGKTLESFIQGDASGDYKKMLLAICGN